MKALKEAAKNLQNASDKTEHEIEKVEKLLADTAKKEYDRKVNYFPNAINQYHSGTPPWPPGSNPSYRTEDRREEEINDGWIR